MRKKSGQTLIEVMVALFVLVVGMLGILSLLAQSLAISKNIGNNMIATYLAEEGIELTKNLIDHDVYQHIAGFGTGWGTCFGSNPAEYEIDYTTTNCANIHKYSNNDVLSFDPTTNMYLYNYDDVTGSSVPTIFTRQVFVTPDPNASIPEITVQSIVTWPVGLGTENVTLEDHFFNWRPN